MLVLKYVEGAAAVALVPLPAASALVDFVFYKDGQCVLVTTTLDTEDDSLVALHLIDLAELAFVPVPPQHARSVPDLVVSEEVRE